MRLGFQVGLLRTRCGQFAVRLAERLARQGGVVGADEQVRLGAELLDLALRLGDLGPQIVDLAGEPATRGSRLVLARVLLEYEVVFRNRVGDARGKLRVGGLELDRDHARLVDREYRQPLEIGLENALLRRHAQRVLGETEEAERIAHQRHAAQRRVELRQVAELQLVDHRAREIPRERELNLAGHRLLVDGAVTALAGFLGFRPQENVLAAFDQDARFGFVFRRDDIDAGQGERRNGERGSKHPPLLARERLADGAQIKLAIPHGLGCQSDATLLTHSQLRTVRDHATAQAHQKALRLPSR